MTKEEFTSTYKLFTENLPLTNEGKYAKLYTDARNSPFKVYKNSQGSIVVKAFTDDAAGMVISLDQLNRVKFDNGRYYYPSYEPVLLKRIENKKLIKSDEIELEQQIEFKNEPIRQETQSLYIKNIILYGAPGVGKTHNTSRLIHYIEGGLPFYNIFDRLKSNHKEMGYDAFENAKFQGLVKFITFHQSFGYEDFIEGFRPNSQGNIELIDGIFKELCTPNKINLSPIFNKLVEFRSNCIDNAVDTKKIIREMNTDNTLNKHSVVNEIRLGENYFDLILENKSVIQVTYDELHDYILDHLFDEFETKFLKVSKYRSSLYMDILYRFFIEWLNKNNLVDDFKDIVKNTIASQTKKNEKNRYLVIDEINRGNISKIFGELITLIEEDKRDKLEVTLPYSKQPFRVPSNLYIIGTMNSTDKSIALMDIALRRRFTFLKMEPNSDLVPKFARDKFEALNQYISASHLGEDYRIGHSYFMNIHEDELPFVIEYKIKPLLEEYFYGDKEGLDKALEVLK